VIQLATPRCCTPLLYGIVRRLLVDTSKASDLGALGGTRTPNLLIRRSMESVPVVRRNPNPHVSVLLVVRHKRHSPVSSFQSVGNL
jgi:hypothetical protein